MKTIEFEIIYAKNQSIHQEGYVEVTNDEEEPLEWFYYDQNGFGVPRQFINHDEIGIDQIGATYEQIEELDKFKTLVNYKFVDFINEVIAFSEEDEHKTILKGDLIIKINDGAKFEVEIKDAQAEYGDFNVSLFFKFNGRTVHSKEFLKRMEEQFDPYLLQEDNTLLINPYSGKIIFEISKDYFEGDDDCKALNETVILEEAQKIYQSILFEKADYENDTLEQFLDGQALENDELFGLQLLSTGKMSINEYNDWNGFDDG